MVSWEGVPDTTEIGVACAVTSAAEAVDGLSAGTADATTAKIGKCGWRSVSDTRVGSRRYRTAAKMAAPQIDGCGAGFDIYALPAQDIGVKYEPG